MVELLMRCEAQLSFKKLPRNRRQLSDSTR